MCRKKNNECKCRRKDFQVFQLNTNCSFSTNIVMKVEKKISVHLNEDLRKEKVLEYFEESLC